MLEASAERLLTRLGPDDLVLDVGGGANPFPRADWVLDLVGYEERGAYGTTPDALPERFSSATWVQRDICERSPWPFADGQFDFSICSHTLEDVRDPVYVCSELIRVSRAGYIEVPSRLEEQSWGVLGPWVGWSHHRWLVDLENSSELTFVHKPHVIHTRPGDSFPRSFWEALSPEQRVLQLWWEGSFGYRERVMLSAEELDGYLAELVERHLPGGRGGGEEPREEPREASREPGRESGRGLRRGRRERRRR